MRREQTKLYERRIRNFLDRLQGGLVFEERMDLSAEFCRTEDPVPFTDRESGTFKKIAQGEKWGETWDSAWFHITGQVPAEWKGKNVVAHLGFGGEACVFDKDGCAVYGLTNGSVFKVHYGKDIHFLFDSCAGGERVDLWVETAANNLFGVNRPGDPPRDDPKRHGQYDGRVTDLELCVFNEEVWGLMHDVRVLGDLMRVLPEALPRRERLRRGLSKAIDVYADDRSNAKSARAILAPLLESPANASDMKVTAVGHAHIDTAWLWPVRESLRKCARTFSSQVALLERYPDYVFGASQAQLYAYTKEHYPAVYQKIKDWVKEGRWEVQGGMWVEADCNVISGESMVRQFVHGKNFFRDEFGVDIKNLWLPDVFGYSAALPQILRRAGVDYFLTQKISWSQFNVFPHNTFVWKGIDGTGVLTHFPPEDTYNSEMLPGAMYEAQNRFKENHVLDEFISLYGIGNGGGGPKEDHVERAMRMADLEGCPKVTFGRADAFFERIEKSCDDLERWSGELYLELHRGTLTTQARTKLGNRRLEQRLRDTEFLYSCLPLAQYPSAELDRIWKVLLLNQFHDIIPGSSIHKVYEVTESEYAECLAECDALVSAGAEKLLEKTDDSLVLLNSLSYPYTAPVNLPDGWAGCGAENDSGEALPTQSDSGGTTVLVDLPPQSCITLRKSGRAESPEAGSDLILENDLVRYEFNRDATIRSAYDKEAERNILAELERGNLISLYEDRPNGNDAWDVDVFYESQLLETAKPVSQQSLGAGPVRQGLTFSLKIGDSTVDQQVFLPTNSKRLDFVTNVDWQEVHRMLRVSFPAALRSEHATFDIQYGYVKRTTHTNTSWDMAQFEVSGQRYADLSTGDYGVALLNDCKYGHKVKDNVLDLNLLRSPTEPDPDADLGQHTFTYSLLPHIGCLQDSPVMAEAAMLNQRPVLLDGYAAGKTALPCALESDGISLEVVKKAEKEDCLVIRLVETLGRTSTGVLKVADRTATLVETGLMEWIDGETTPCAEDIPISLTPFEIRTYKIRS
jgi:alpha-mannosidase